MSKFKSSVHKDAELARAVPAVPYVLAKGHRSAPIELYKDRHDNIVAFHYFDAPVRIGNIVLHVQVQVGEDENGNLVYHLTRPVVDADKTKDPELAHVKSRDPGSSATDAAADHEGSIPDSPEEFNLVILGSWPVEK